MIKRLMVAVPVAIALALSACAPFVSTSGEGAIQIYFGAPTGARALSDPPFTELPVFSGITIKVSGPGMDPVEFTVDATQTSFTAMVPGGSNRTVELYAPVDWAATYDRLFALYPTNMPALPTLVKAYGATTTIDVVPGQRVTAVLRLEVAETKILLPDAYYSSYLHVADGLHPVAAPMVTSLYSYSNSDYEFDRYGRLLYSTGTVHRAQNENDSAPGSLVLSGDSLAFDSASNVLYAWYDGDGTNLNGYDYGSESPAQYQINEPSGYSFGIGSVAVDAHGYVYVPLYQYSSESTGIGKISVGAPSGGYADTQVLAYQPLTALGLEDPLEIRDMTVKDGRLYVLAGQNVGYGVPHHGKLVEIDPSSLQRLRELGWTSADYPTNPATQFYGPQRFIALAPRKLIIADEGSNGSTDVDRVVEVDLSDWQIRDIGLDGEVTFFNSYAC